MEVKTDSERPREEKWLYTVKTGLYCRQKAMELDGIEGALGLSFWSYGAMEVGWPEPWDGARDGSGRPS